MIYMMVVSDGDCLWMTNIKFQRNANDIIVNTNQTNKKLMPYPVDLFSFHNHQGSLL